MHEVDEGTQLALQRTYFEGEEVDRVPALRRSAHRLQGGLQVATLALAAGLFLLPMLMGWPLACFLWLAPLPFVPRMAASLARRMLHRRLAGGADAVRGARQLSAAPDGGRVRLQGTVRALQTTSGVLCPGPVCASRAALLVPFSTGVLVHERAHAFLLEPDDGGGAVRIEPGGGLLLGPARTGGRADPEAIRSVFSAGAAAEARAALGSLQGNPHVQELCIGDGDPVEVVGIKSRRVDPSVVERLPRQTPLRATLEGTEETPLLVVASG